jgi:hypothetical protein
MLGVSAGGGSEQGFLQASPLVPDASRTVSLSNDHTYSEMSLPDWHSFISRPEMRIVLLSLIALILLSALVRPPSAQSEISITGADQMRDLAPVTSNGLASAATGSPRGSIWTVLTTCVSCCYRLCWQV